MSGDFKVRTFHNEVLRMSKATHAVRNVLRLMMWNSEWREGGRTVTITRPQIEEETGYSRSCVFAAIRFLKNEGTINPIRNKFGGRGNAPTYEICVPKGVNNQTKGVNNQTKGVNNPPPTIYPIYSMSAASGEGARQWRGRQAEKGGAGGDRRALTPEEKKATKRRNLAEKLAGDYGGGKRLIAAWDAGEIPEGQPWP